MCSIGTAHPLKLKIKNKNKKLKLKIKIMLRQLNETFNPSIEHKSCCSSRCSLFHFTMYQFCYSACYIFTGCSGIQSELACLLESLTLFISKAGGLSSFLPSITALASSKVSSSYSSRASANNRSSFDLLANSFFVLSYDS